MELNKEFIEDELRKVNKEIGSNILIYDIIDSTNQACKEMGRTGGLHGSVILAKEQSKGRGRLGREWDSKVGDGIYMSLLLKPSILPNTASLLTLLAALSVNRGIRKVTGLDSFIKWPNDIVLAGKKVCGILTEMQTLQNKLDFVVVGIGINVNHEFFSANLKELATSLCLECGQKIDMNQLIVEILKEFEEIYYDFIHKEEFSFIKEYNENLVNRNRYVRILDGDRESIGTALGINESGALLVELQDENKVIEVVSGEVSVRGICGYI